MAMPDSIIIEIEFTAGNWTDVTAYLDGQAGGSTRFGRTSPYGSISPGTLTLTLANEDARFTPNRQVLADGVTAHPYWPNVVPRKRIRYAWVIAGVRYYRFTGYIKGWPPSMVNGDIARVVIVATTADDRLSRVTLRPSITDSIMSGNPFRYWPLTDSADVNQGVEFKGRSFNLTSSGSGSAVAFGSDGPDSGAGVKFTPGSATSGQLLRSTLSFPPSSPITVLVWFNAGTSMPGFAALMNPVVWLTGYNWSIGLNNSPAGLAFMSHNAWVGNGLNFADGAWHQFGLRWDGTSDFDLLIDGVENGHHAMAPNDALAVPLRSIVIGGVDPSDDAATVTTSLANFRGNVGQVSIFARAISNAELADQYAAGLGYRGETVDVRIKRFLSLGGLGSGDWTVAASDVALGGYDQAGKDITGAAQDAAISEGGGAACFVGPDGKVQFSNRAFRTPGAPAFVLDAEGDLDALAFQPAYDDTQIVNQVQGTQANGSTTASTQVVNDAVSQAAYGVTGSTFTSYALDPADVLHNAQDQIARQRQPAYQIPQIALDLTTATTPGLYAAVAAATIGSRMRVANLPPGAAPVTQIDLHVEGWADTFSTDSCTVTFDTSPADRPAAFVWGDATYGRWQCDGQTLSGALAVGATTVVIATTAGLPTFTTDPTMYPLTITVGEERLQLNSAPGGASSPQTFTGVTRAVDGTVAAAQASGSSVALYPTSTWVL